MRVIVCDNYEQISETAARIVAGQINLKPDCVLGLATGSTPIGLYDKLAELNKNGEVDFSEVTSFNLDEYYPIKKDNPQSYDYFMKEQLFSKVNINIENTYIPNGEAKDAQAECENYEKLIEEKGGIDLQILGIGKNGHIGFNEPDECLITKTHITDLTQSTIDANSIFFDKAEDMPAKALTMGIATILSSKKIVLLANGAGKYEAVSALMNDEITTNTPATMLKVHPDVVIICDKAAYTGKAE